ncbi:hypothetical protein D7Y41_32660 [Anaerotruncus sp. 1XD22-93]|nr:hypothetical protein [Lachnospiraceae bacterium]NBI76941.1 hypothetical protein [Lachnospiraceae bacterium]RKJ75835.1 hypothetical protein D7Y41_32660 [Anaerotruncus sp. 1XD22-93]
MGGLSNSEVNASIRGYILRSLVKGYNFSLSAKTLANKMQANGLISGTSNISRQLYYLYGYNLIQFSGKSDAFSALEDDAVIRLTVEGIRFIESGGNSEMGIDL